MLSRTLGTASLRRLFLNLARGAAASSTLAACAAEHVAGGGRNEKWAAVSCSESLARVGEIDPKADLDQVAVYSVYRPDFGDPLPEAERQQYPIRRAETGELCSKADAIPDCEELIEGLEQQRCEQVPCTFALTRQGDKLARIDERDAFLALLGDVNTTAEAVLLAAYDQHVICLHSSSEDRYADQLGARVRADGSGYQLESTYQQCSEPLYRKRWSISREGEIAELESEELAPPNCVPGRRPPGLCERDAPASPRAGAFLADCARMEHASIYAFEQLLRELEAHGAPAALRQRVREAIYDEARHTRAMGELARTYGAIPRAPEVTPSELRSLFQIAVDNATEGCLRETFSALIATYQAENARDARVRSALGEIAQDETRHAALSWQLMAWLTPQLSDTERAYVREAQRQAAAELVQGDACALNAHERALLGMPERDVCARLAQGMLDALLSDQVALA